MSEDTPHPSLYARSQGPQARSLLDLARQGEKAHQRACEEYGGFLATRLCEIEVLCRKTTEPTDTVRRIIGQSVHDIRTSAATAGLERIVEFCALLEQALRAPQAQDHDLLNVIIVHLDAIRMAANPSFPAADLTALAEKLLDLQYRKLGL